MNKILKLAAICLAVAPMTANAYPVVVNGSFEADPYSGTYSVDPPISGWNKTGNDGVYPLGVNNSSYLGDTPYGSQYIVLGRYGGAGGQLYQTVSDFDLGSTYGLGFAIASELPGNARVQVSFDSGSSTPSQIFLAPSSTYWSTWQDFSYDFVATASSVTFRFSDIGSLNGGYDIGLDNVKISGGPPSTSVPEPASLALLGIGLAGLGAMRRRKQMD